MCKRVEVATDEQLPITRPTARVPCKPAGRPVAKCDGGKSVTVKWTRPEDDGGADITAYIIKYGDVWTRVDDYATVKVVGDTTNFTFTDQLKERTWYNFAVAVENTAGRGEFSEFSYYSRTRAGKHSCD